MEKRPFYVTTPIYYVNGLPHIGTAYTTIAADVLARYHRMMGHETLFLTGTDEHGQKVEEAAEKKGLKPKAFADEVVAEFKKVWSALNISNDRFIRTTDADHKAVVHDLWKKMEANGDIYLGEYEDWYCVHDETFWTQGQLLEGKLCPNEWCKRPVEKHKEKSYFFKLSKYTEPLLKYYEEHPDFVLPDYRLNEVKSFVSQGLNDLSISRTTFDWGLPTPDDPAHVIYVWVDALTNYLTGSGYLVGDSEKYETFWPATVHLIGKDILRFHAIYWPAFLMSAGLPLPKHVMAHGFWTIEGGKMSKSLGNWIDPMETIEDYGLDALRYFLMREIPLGPDGDFSKAGLVGRINSDLANDLGNLLSRSLAMTKKYAASLVPKPTDGNSPLGRVCKRAEEKYNEAFSKKYSPHHALLSVWEIIKKANQYIDEKAPWVLAKDESKAEELQGVLYDLLESIRRVGVMLWPVMPDAIEKLMAQMGLDETAITGESLEGWGRLKEGLEIQRGKSLFPRVDKVEANKEQKPKERKKAEQKPKEEKAVEGVRFAEFSDFQKLQMKVGVIKSAEPVPETDKLLHLFVDTGEVRSIVAGIAEHYKPEDLVGKKVVILVNLKPRKLRGVLSEGMMLAAKSKQGTLRVLTIDGGDLPAGAKIS